MGRKREKRGLDVRLGFVLGIGCRLLAPATTAGMRPRGSACGIGLATTGSKTIRPFGRILRTKCPGGRTLQGCRAGMSPLDAFLPQRERALGPFQTPCPLLPCDLNDCSRLAFARIRPHYSLAVLLLQFQPSSPTLSFPLFRPSISVCYGLKEMAMRMKVAGRSR